MKFFNLNQTGDTIVEVIISVAIMSSALAAAYSLGTVALRNSESANHRTEALSLAQSQIELLKNVSKTNGDLSPYQTSTPYCIDFTGKKQTSCNGFNSTIYNVSDTYDASSQVFTVNVQWPDGQAAGGQANLAIYYRL